MGDCNCRRDAATCFFLALELGLRLGPGRQARSAPLLLCAWLTTVSKAAWQIN